MTNKTIAVVGAGIIGITSAYMLRQAGYKVVLVDAEHGPALKTSFANGCQLSYSYVDAMSSPSLVKKLPKLLLGADPAFRVNLFPDMSLLKWSSRFLWQGQAAREQKNTQDLLRLSHYSRQVLHQLLSQSALEFAHRESGKLVIYTNPQDFDNAKARVAQKRAWGCKQEILTPQECIAIQPSLQRLPKPLAGGIYAATDEVGDPHRFANQLLDQLVKDTGFEARFNCLIEKIVRKGSSVQSLETSTGSLCADAYVWATGAESLPLLTDIGLNVPIYPIKGYSLTVPATESAPDVCITDIDNKVVVARVGDRLRIAGCADIVGYDPRMDQQRIAHLLQVCRSHFPDAGHYNEVLNTWAGFRPVTPSSVPIIGQAGADNLFLNMGHGMLGWTLALGSASLLTAQVKQQALPIDATGMRPEDHGIS